MNQIKQKIKDIGLSQREISKRLGKNPCYLASALKKGLSTAKQQELLEDLKTVANGGTVISDDGLIEFMSEQLDELQDTCRELRKNNQDLRDESDKYFVERNELQEQVDNRAIQMQLTQKFLLEANQECEELKDKYESAMKVNWLLITTIIVGVILWGATL